MRLEQQKQAADEQPRLTEEELSAVLNAAIARQGEADRLLDAQVQRRAHLATMEDAVEIARQLNIPEEHVRAAAAELTKGKLRPARREAVRAKRKAAFLKGLSTLGLVSFFSLILVNLFNAGIMTWLFTLGLTLWLPVFLITLYLGFRWLAGAITDAEADALELAPVSGQCRVCGAPAYNERATFCEEHRYRGPA